MKTRSPLLLLVAMAAGASFVGGVFAQSTVFTYQGRLTVDGAAAAAPYDFEFRLFTAAAGGSQVGSVLSRDDLPVTGGLFVVSLDFGGVFDGAPRFLAISVRPGASTGSFTSLAPRQPLTPTPYAIRALESPAIPAGTITGSMLVDAAVTAAKLADNAVGTTAIADGSISASDLNLGTFDATFWKLTGNAGTSVAGQFLGTTDDEPLELRANQRRGLRLEAGIDFDGSIPLTTGFSNTVTLVGGSPLNVTPPGTLGVTIGGGGGQRVVNNGSLVVVEDLGNEVHEDFGTVAGGLQNRIQGRAATISGGESGWIGTDSSHAGIGGGWLNFITNNAYGATISGGIGNTAGQNAAVAGGVGNRALGVGSFVGGGGEWNPGGSHAGNLAGGRFSTVAGGALNQAEGEGATVPGGFDNVAAGGYSFAAGIRARANHAGSFVWADTQNGEAASVRVNQFKVRASGGALFEVNNSHWVDLRASGNILVPPLALISTSTGAYLSQGGSWVNSSDRARKENFQSVDTSAILEKVAALPLNEWNYRADSVTRHLGPTAQDFRASFGLGADDQHIATVDADGVALAAIQGLNQKLEQRLEQKETEIAELKGQNADLLRRLERLEARLFERDSLTPSSPGRE